MTEDRYNKGVTDLDALEINFEKYIKFDLPKDEIDSIKKIIEAK